MYCLTLCRTASAPDVLPYCTAAAGKSGIEFAGWSNDQTNLADSRAAQSAQAIAYPSNVGNPVNPLTCTQARMLLRFGRHRPIALPECNEGQQSLPEYTVDTVSAGSRRFTVELRLMYGYSIKACSGLVAGTLAG